MKTIKDILIGISCKHIEHSLHAEISWLTIDSRNAISQSMYFAIKGTQTDGHQFIQSAIEKGATAIVCETLPQTLVESVTYIQVASVAQIVGIAAANFYDWPSKEMKIIGVTGTNGKTTVATLGYKLFNSLGYKCGLLSTVENKIGEQAIPATHTTPDAITIQQLMAQMLAQKCSHVFMEISSHAIDQARIAGIDFNIGIFTNITHDHLDYHHTFDNYIKAKKQFFDHLPDTAFALTNADDKRGEVMLQNTQATKKSFALKSWADFKGKILENEIDGLLMDIDQQQVHFRLIGTFNAYNLLAIYGAATLLGESTHEVLSVLSNITSAPGRFDVYRSAKEKIVGIVDYAHTPDALLNVLATIKQFNSIQRIITVVGCGGDRDKEKRPLMALATAEHSTQAIFTSDNPRSEDEMEILREMEAGLKPQHHRKVLKIADRKEAIKTAVSIAQKGDVILIAGKGHETYQEIKGIKKPFDDKAVLLELFELLDK